MILIHTALLCEAQTFIEKLKLKKINSNSKTNYSPKIYSNDKYIVVISGIGKENTIKALGYIFNNYKISKAINIGIAGSSNKDIKIGTFFCINSFSSQIITVDKPITSNNSNIKENILYDMESKYFLDISLKYLDNKNIYIFKIVSDHLNGMNLSKDEIKNMILSNYKKVINSL